VNPAAPRQGAAVLRNGAQRVAGRLSRQLGSLQRGEVPQVHSAENGERNSVDTYWGLHTVAPDELPPPEQWSRGRSTRQLEWRFEQYPLFREFSGLWGDHDGEVLVDYGCGPGNDLVGFAIHTGARKIVGIDVSPKALGMAAERLALHRVDPTRVELIHKSDASAGIPLADASADYVQSQGVIHHATDPDGILSELHRVLRPGGRGCVMVYNRDSVWRHLYVAYERMILERAFRGADLDEAFRRSTDGDECPISRCYEGAEFTAMCERAGFEAEYMGGYLSLHELSRLKELGERAIADDRLAEEHRRFLGELDMDPAGMPTYSGKHAGIGGVYRLRRPEAGV
jgi:ubiquinone/menaquinone biosynthesis C-methylase UbiE